MDTMGQRIRALRLKKELTHQQMADLLGMSRQGFTRIEADQVNITQARIEQIADILGVEPGALFPPRPQQEPAHAS